MDTAHLPAAMAGTPAFSCGRIGRQLQRVVPRAPPSIGEGVSATSRRHPISSIRMASLKKGWTELSGTSVLAPERESKVVASRSVAPKFIEARYLGRSQHHGHANGPGFPRPPSLSGWRHGGPEVVQPLRACVLIVPGRQRLIDEGERGLAGVGIVATCGTCPGPCGDREYPFTSTIARGAVDEGRRGLAERADGVGVVRLHVHALWKLTTRTPSRSMRRIQRVSSSQTSGVKTQINSARGP